MNKKQKNQIEVYHDVCAYRYIGCQVTAFDGVRKPASAVNARTVESLPLIIREPQWVRFADRYYHVQREGLYRFWDWGKAKVAYPGANPTLVQNRQRYSCVIYYHRDVKELLGSLAAIHLHGCRHQELGHRDRMVQAKKGSLSLTCGRTSDFVCEILNGLGWKTRRVSALRVRGAYNTWDNGHELLEFFWPRYHQWVLADVDMHTLFTHQGRYLNLGQVSERIQSGMDFDLEPLTLPGIGLADTTEGTVGKFDFSPLIELMAHDPVRRKEWFRRTLTIPVMYADDQGWFFCSDGPSSTKIKRYAPQYQSLDKRAWFNKFYP